MKLPPVYGILFYGSLQRSKHSLSPILTFHSILNLLIFFSSLHQQPFFNITVIINLQKSIFSPYYLTEYSSLKLMVSRLYSINVFFVLHWLTLLGLFLLFLLTSMTFVEEYTRSQSLDIFSLYYSSLMFMSRLIMTK